MLQRLEFETLKMSGELDCALFICQEISSHLTSLLYPPSSSQRPDSSGQSLVLGEVYEVQYQDQYQALSQNIYYRHQQTNSKFNSEIFLFAAKEDFGKNKNYSA